MHSELARSDGVPEENIFKARNGMPLEIGLDRAVLGEEQHSGVIYVDGVDLADPNDASFAPCQPRPGTPP